MSLPILRVYREPNVDRRFIGPEAFAEAVIRFEDEDFCLFFRIDPNANTPNKFKALRVYFQEHHTPARFHEAVSIAGGPMEYRRLRYIVGMTDNSKPRRPPWLDMDKPPYMASYP